MLPAKHKLWVTLIWEGAEYYTTSPINDRSVYSLYRQTADNKCELLSTSTNPLKLEERVYSGKYNKEDI